MKKNKTNTKDSLALRFLYRTIVGRMILKLLVKPGVSRMAVRSCFAAVCPVFCLAASYLHGQY